MLDFLVLGGGHAACATAAELALRGASVGLLEVPEFIDRLEQVRRRGGFEINHGSAHNGRFASLDIIESDPSTAQLAPVLLIVVPAYAEPRFIQFVTPWLRRGRTLVFACGTLNEFMSNKNISSWQSTGVDVAVLEALVQGGRREGVLVNLNTRKHNVRVAAAVGESTAISRRLENLYTDLQPVSDPLEAALGNLNLVFHPVISLANLGRLGASFRYYAEGVAAEVGILLEALDAERLSIGQSAGYSLDSCGDTLRRWYPGVPDPPLWQQVSRNPAYSRSRAPRALNHRFFLEDIPFGLVPLERIGRRLNVPSPLTTSLIEIASILVGRDLRKEASFY